MFFMQSSSCNVWDLQQINYTQIIAHGIVNFSHTLSVSFWSASLSNSVVLPSNLNSPFRLENYGSRVMHCVTTSHQLPSEMAIWTWDIETAVKFCASRQHANNFVAVRFPFFKWEKKQNTQMNGTSGKSEFISLQSLSTIRRRNLIILLDLPSTVVRQENGAFRKRSFRPEKF